MNDSFSLEQISGTGNLDSNLISRQNKLNLFAVFMRIKYGKPKLKLSEIANHLSYSSSPVQRYRNDIYKLTAYRTQANNTNKRTKKASNTIFGNNSLCGPDVKRPEMTSNDPKTTQAKTKSNKKDKNVLKTGSVQENIEINDQFLDEISENNDI